MLPVCVKTLASGDQVIAPDESGSCGMYLMQQPDLETWNAALYGGPDSAMVTDPQVRAIVHQEVPPSPFSLTMEQGATVSAAVLGVWFAAWGIKACIRVLRQRESAE